MGIPGPFSGRRFVTLRSSLPRLLTTTLLLVLVGLALTLPSFGANPDEPIPGSTTVLSQPEPLEELARNPIWLALLHQARRPLDRGARRALHEAEFFFHSEGARQPELELIATRDSFQLPNEELALANRCRFPARHRFLAEHGIVPAERGVCPELDEWRATIGEFELTLVFPEAFLGNPASMFGHTLLRLDPPDDGSANEPNAVLGWALDYSASAEGDAGALYLLRGLAGGYRGRFTIARYYERIKVYSDWQDRDIWEYPLSMSREGRERMLLHVWELREVSLPYYFFTQNCSEKLLELLEVGWSRLERHGGFPPAVTPVDTLRAMTAAGDVIGKPVLRPSPATRLQVAMSRLSVREFERVEGLADGRIAIDDPSLDALDESNRARQLELAYDLLRHHYLAGKATEGDSRARSRALLLARSRLKVSREMEPSVSTRERIPPDQGHGTARVELTGGIQDRDGFIELHLQPAFHTTLDAPGGFAEGGVIKALDTRIRFFPELQRVRLQELVLLEVSTASPWRRPFRPLGWRFDLGLRTRLFSSRHDRGLDTEAVFRMHGGIGAGAAPLPGLHVYAFGELALEAAPRISGNASVGPVARLGFSYSTPRGRYTVQAETLTGVLAGAKTSPWLKFRLEQRVGLSQNWSMLFGGHYEHAYDVGHFEGRIGLIRYF